MSNVASIHGVARLARMARSATLSEPVFCLRVAKHSAANTSAKYSSHAGVLPAAQGKEEGPCPDVWQALRLVHKWSGTPLEGRTPRRGACAGAFTRPKARGD
jgi:hypothetical protein